MSSMKKTVYLIAVASLVFMFTFFGLFVQNHSDVCYAVGLICMIVSYHIIIRLVIGSVVDAALDYQIDSSKSWFEDSDAERALYKMIGVKTWKKKLPAFDDPAFSLKKHSLEDIISVSCQSEIVHEINILASLAGILLSIPFGVMWLFILTSVAGAVFDLVIVTVHRYNRPRLIRAAERQRRMFFEKLAFEDAVEEGGEQDPLTEVHETGEDEPDFGEPVIEIHENNENDLDLDKPVNSEISAEGIFDDKEINENIDMEDEK